MGQKKISLRADLAFQGLIILMMIAVLCISFDAQNLSINIILLCIINTIVIITYFTSLRTGLIYYVVFAFLFLAWQIFHALNTGASISWIVYFWIAWPLGMVFTTASFIKEHKSLDRDNQNMKRKWEQYVTIDEVTQANNLLAFERDAATYMNISRRYDLDMVLLLWNLTYQSDLERLVEDDELENSISLLTDSIKKSLRKEDLIYLVDQNPYIWGTLLFTKPDAAQIVIEHVQEEVEKTDLSEYIKQKDYSLEMTGTVLVYDRSIMTPLAFLELAKNSRGNL